MKTKTKATITLIATIALALCAVISGTLAVNSIIFNINTSATVPSTPSATLVLGSQTIPLATVTPFNFGTLTLDASGNYLISNQTLTLKNTGNTNLSSMTITASASTYPNTAMIEVDSNGSVVGYLIVASSTPQSFSLGTIAPGTTWSGYLTMETPSGTSPNTYTLDIAISLS
jgi:hypothetical protein